MTFEPGAQIPGNPDSLQPAAAPASEPELEHGTRKIPAQTDIVDLARRARSLVLDAAEAREILIAAQQILAGLDTKRQCGMEARKAIDHLAGNPYAPADVLHSAVIYRDGTIEHERTWQHGGGSEKTTRLVVYNPSAAIRTLELIARTPGGKVSYEAWKQLKLKG